MDAQQLATVTTLIAEVALALHPILIKTVPANLPTQLLARLGTYTVLGTLLSGPKDHALTWGSSSLAFQSILLGFMNLIHIGSSYLSYKLLPAGSALALFYTYPFFNILAGFLFLGDKVKLTILPLLAMAFAGVLMIANYTKDGNGKHQNKSTPQAGAKAEKSEDFKNEAPADVKGVVLGVAMALVSAITETMIFLVAKTAAEPSPWFAILRLYPGALLGLLGLLFARGDSISTESATWIPLILFNVFIGFLGYSLRFYSIPRLPTAIFSILTFIGVAAGYGWGLMYAKEIPSLGALLGAGLITGSLGILRYT